jgi:hypothetical protein
MLGQCVTVEIEASTLQPPFEIAIGIALVAAEIIRHACGQKDAENEEVWHCRLLRDIFGPLPFRPVTPDPAWLTPTVVALAQSLYADSSFTDLPILADALEEAGCTGNDILSHCRQPGEHVRGCWVVDLLLGKR